MDRLTTLFALYVLPLISLGANTRVTGELRQEKGSRVQKPRQRCVVYPTHVHQNTTSSTKPPPPPHTHSLVCKGAMDTKQSRIILVQNPGMEWKKEKPKKMRLMS